MEQMPTKPMKRAYVGKRIQITFQTCHKVIDETEYKSFTSSNLESLVKRERFPRSWASNDCSFCSAGGENCLRILLSRLCVFAELRIQPTPARSGNELANLKHPILTRFDLPDTVRSFNISIWRIRVLQQHEGAQSTCPRPPRSSSSPRCSSPHIAL